MKESGENYLETILLLWKRQGQVRSVDVANTLGVTKASVSRAMGILRGEGLLLTDRQGMLTLTERGSRVAQDVYERHCTIRLFLCRVLALSEETAEQDACRIEHVISEETFAAMKQYLSKL